MILNKHELSPLSPIKLWTLGTNLTRPKCTWQRIWGHGIPFALTSTMEAFEMDELTLLRTCTHRYIDRSTHVEYTPAMCSLIAYNINPQDQWKQIEYHSTDEWMNISWLSCSNVLNIFYLLHGIVVPALFDLASLFLTSSLAFFSSSFCSRFCFCSSVSSFFFFLPWHWSELDEDPDLDLAPHFFDFFAFFFFFFLS